MKAKSLFNSLLVVFVVSIVIANMVGARVITTGIKLFGIELSTSGGAITYAFTFLCTDIIGELWGKRRAMEVVKYGFVGQVFALVMVVATGFCRCDDAAMDGAYSTLFSQNWSFCLGSLAAYYASQTWDVFVFHKVKGMYLKTLRTCYKGQGRWIWNNVSTMTSQVVDTAIYAAISFGLGLGWFFDKAMWPALGGLVVGQYVLKATLAVVDTPIFYIFTRRRRR